MIATAVVEAPAARRPLRPWDYCTLNVYWFALSFLWNSMGPILLPSMIPLLVPESQKAGALGLISALGLTLAIIVQPAAGAWTDRAHTGSRLARWGRRKPYIVGGTLFDVVFLLAMAVAGNYVVLLVAYLLLQLSSNIAHGPYQGYIPDLVPESKRGSVSGIARFFEIIGIIITSLATGALVGQGQILLAFVAICFFLVVCMIITALCVTEEPYADPDAPTTPPAPDRGTQTAAPSSGSLLHSLFYSRDFFLWLVSRLLILLGGNLVRNYALYFLQDVLHLQNAAAEVGNLLAIIAVAIAIVVFPAGWLSDRWGRKSLTMASGLLGAAGACALVSAATMGMVLADGAVIGVSIGIFLSVNWAWATDLVPANDCGRLMGISNLATAGSGVLAGLGGYLLDYFNAQSPNLGYTVLYAAAAICYLGGTAIAWRVKDERRERLSALAAAAE